MPVRAYSACSSASSTMSVFNEFSTRQCGERTRRLRRRHTMQHFSPATENAEECVPPSKTARACQADDASRQLDAHDLHRKAPRPLVSTLVGLEGRAIHVWRQWRRVHGADVLILREPSLDCLCAQLSHRI